LHTQSKFRLLVVRLGAMGDILHALPAMTALRQAHPAWVIDWVVEPAWMPLLTAGNGKLAEAVSAAQPIVDGVYLASAKAWGQAPLSRKTAYEIRSLREALKDGTTMSCWISRERCGRRRLLAGRCAARDWRIEPREWAARWLFTERVKTSGAHVIEQDVELAGGGRDDALQPGSPGCR
jgi:heptosyltransferase-1